MKIFLKSLTVAYLSVLFVAAASAESEAPSREAIDATVAEMTRFSSANDYSSWAGLFAEDATFINAVMAEPKVGREAIVEYAGTWPPAETVVEWRVIEGNRMAMGWRERRALGEGKYSGWYRGFSTFTFNASGEVQAYEGMFNPMAIQAAIQGGN